MIDLHLHTTASDGALRPAALVARAAAAGITSLSVTDHDTTGGLAEARAEAESRRLTFLNGIEITAVEDDRDIHVLGYFFDPSATALREFLDRQREDRVRRVREISARLDALGLGIDLSPLIARGVEKGQSVGRAHVAAALVAGGYVQSWDEAFKTYLERGRPAFVPRRGASVEAVVCVIHDAGGVASLAHPGLIGVDPLIPGFAHSGLDAIEARHSDHSPETETRYLTLATAMKLAVSGGSDFHGDAEGRRCALGTVTITDHELQRLQARRR